MIREKPEYIACKKKVIDTLNIVCGTLSQTDENSIDINYKALFEPLYLKRLILVTWQLYSTIIEYMHLAGVPLEQRLVARDSFRISLAKCFAVFRSGNTASLSDELHALAELSIYCFNYFKANCREYY